MDFFGVLVVATTLFILLSVAVWQKTRDVAFILGFIFLYFWTLYGGWAVVIDASGGQSGKHYQYLFDRLFLIELDEDYLWALVYYAIFSLIVQIAVLFRAKAHVRTSSPHVPIMISHKRVLFVGLTSGILSYLIMRSQLELAATLNLSSYAVTRGMLGETSRLFTVHQILNRMALFPLTIGASVLIAGRNAKHVVGRGSLELLSLYSLGLIGMYTFCLVLGNKNELLASLALGLLFYVVNSPRVHWIQLSVAGIAGITLISFVDLFRGLPAGTFHEHMEYLDIFRALSWISDSNEAFCSHFSLYGAIHFNIPLTLGTSILSLLASVVPRFLWPGRPDTIYSHYALAIGAPADQGFAIHHATGWYLNFGIFGIVLGAVILGYIWAWLHNRFHNSRKTSSIFVRIFDTVTVWSFTAYLPSMLRAGPEAYKGAFINVIIPVMALYLATVRPGLSTRDHNLKPPAT